MVTEKKKKQQKKVGKWRAATPREIGHAENSCFFREHAQPSFTHDYVTGHIKTIRPLRGGDSGG
jgi:hypothetical protein